MQRLESYEDPLVTIESHSLHTTSSVGLKTRLPAVEARPGLVFAFEITYHRQTVRYFRAKCSFAFLGLMPEQISRRFRHTATFQRHSRNATTRPWQNGYVRRVRIHEAQIRWLLPYHLISPV